MAKKEKSNRRKFKDLEPEEKMVAAYAGAGATCLIGVTFFYVVAAIKGLTSNK